MTGYSLDSDTVNGIVKGNERLLGRVRAVPLTDRWVSTIVVEEVLGKQISHLNTLRSQRRPFGRESRFLADLVAVFSAFQILPYTEKPRRYTSPGLRSKRESAPMTAGLRQVPLSPV